jgi:hypothetical protein
LSSRVLARIQLFDHRKPASANGKQTILASINKKSYSLNMVIESIREFNRAVPFKPYEIRMASGERHSVPHPDFISISRRGSFVIIIDAKDRPHHLNALLIERATVLNGSHRRPAGSKN